MSNATNYVIWGNKAEETERSTAAIAVPRQAGAAIPQIDETSSALEVHASQSVTWRDAQL